MKTRLAQGSERSYGFTVVEVAVGMLLLSVVSAVAYAGLFSTYAVVGRVDDENRGLTDARFVAERMSRDLRSARGVDYAGSPPPSDRTKLVIWIDRNADYRRTSDEVYTWRLSAGPSGSQFDVIRASAAGGAEERVGSTLVSDVAFAYSPGLCTAPPCEPNFGNVPTASTSTVRVLMSYDAIPGLYSSAKVVGFQLRMRNAE